VEISIKFHSEAALATVTTAVGGFFDIHENTSSLDLAK